MPNLLVTDDEIIYRRVPDREGKYTFKDGRCRVSSAAFGDRSNMQPSVDRAILRGSDPRNTQVDRNDLIVSLITERIRNEAGLSVSRPLENGASCEVDVMADPLGEHSRIVDRALQLANPAHALVRAIPGFRDNERNTFKKLQKALARLATWEIGPPTSC